MKVRTVQLVASDGAPLGSVPLIGGAVHLTPGIECEVWGREGRRLRVVADRLDALKSGVIVFAGDGVPRLENGDPLTPDILRSWGWNEAGDGWVRS